MATFNKLRGLSNRWEKKSKNYEAFLTTTKCIKATHFGIRIYSANTLLLRQTINFVGHKSSI